jgi:hypothetical protein
MSARIVTAARASALIYGVTKAGPEGVWLLPANVCPAVPLALMQAKRPFVFVDINPKTLCMDVKLATQAINQTRRVAGLIYVRIYGYAPQAETDLPALRSALPPGAVLVDDQCLCTPLTELENLNPHGADAVIFSTGYGKVLDLGGGGYGVFYNDLPYAPPPRLSAEEAQKADAALNASAKTAMEAGRALFTDPQSEPLPRWISGDAGANWDDYRALIKNALPAQLTHRDEINQIYAEGLSDLEGITPLVPSDPVWRFNLRARRRDELLAYIFKNGLFASAHYYPASDLFGGPTWPVANALHADILNLFNDQHFSAKQARCIVSLARDFYSPAQ